MQFGEKLTSFNEVKAYLFYLVCHFSARYVLLVNHTREEIVHCSSMIIQIGSQTIDYSNGFLI